MTHDYSKTSSYPAQKIHNSAPRVYDCFMFFNELDILELRLQILDSIVDKFVLVESSVTQKGEEKKLFFEDNKDRFKEFYDKIIHLVYIPSGKAHGAPQHSPKWYIEACQRDFIMQALEGCSPDDIILISDVDEIPDPKIIEKYKNVPGIKVFEQMFMYYYANFICWTHPIWFGTRMGSYADLLDPKQVLPSQEYYAYSAKGLPTYFRFCQGINVSNAGWHFSYCGGTDAIRIKKKSTADGYDYNGELAESEIASIIRRGRDIHGREIFFKIIPLTFLPQYLQENIDKYKKLILCPAKSEKIVNLFHHSYNVAFFYIKKVLRRLRRLFLHLILQDKAL